ncbi:serine protease 27 [Xenopus laevis]|uniref:Serine protease 27 n=1 Tax=Xenopus laevis TaxID=8355 RepID=A0A8J1LS44_XENLA|nr:serine protease 27 [Xenopus laevis]OCT59124.1 hypothetical protein XELAEV_18001613mg [Xenopus laevis]
MKGMMCLFHLMQVLVLLNWGASAFDEETSNQSLAETCGNPVEVSSHNAWGQEAKKGQNPWQVILQLPGKRACGGTLVSNNLVLTAAHCVARVNASSVTITLGAYSITGNPDGEVSVPVEKILIFHRYNNSDSPVDVAIVGLSWNVNFTDFILPACLPTPSTEFLPGHNCKVTEWGQSELHSTNPKPVTLQEVEVQLISVEQCKSFYSQATNNSNITDDMICATDIHGGRGACKGDKGAPLVCMEGKQWYLVGIMTSGYGCGTGFPGVYISVPAMEKWFPESFISNRGSTRTSSAVEGIHWIFFTLYLCWMTLSTPINSIMLGVATRVQL